LSKHVTEAGQLDRRGFLKSSAVAATGVAAAAVPAAAAIAIEGRSGTAATGANPPAVVTKPSGPLPAEPVTAYLRDAKSSEVTVLSGTSETTYKDPLLAQRLLDAAGAAGVNGGGF
jgi:hypothetical protein